MTDSARVARILTKLATLRQRRPDTYGAETHGFALEPPLADEELAALEQTLGLTLPPAFRAFIRQAGRSGAGPYHGLLPPDRWDSALSAGPPMPDYAARPWSFVPDDTPDAFARASAATHEPFQGAIAIADQGCTFYALLVTEGVHRGRIAYINVDGGTPFICAEPDFLAWYERWVDELLMGHDLFWFGTDLAGDEAQLCAAAESDDAQTRNRALAAMARLPVLVGRTADIVAARSRDAAPVTRRLALSLYAKHAGEAVAVHVRRLLNDPEAEIRAEALTVLAACKGDWQPDARRALDDPSPAVVQKALWALIDAKAASVEALARVIARGGSLAQLAANGLAELRLEAALTLLLDLVAAPDAPDLRYAFGVLAQSKTGTRADRERALGYVLQRGAAEGPAAILRTLAAFAGEMPLALDALVEATRNPEPFVRFDAAHLLGECVDPHAPGARAALAALEALSTDETMPKDADRGTVWSVGVSAARAIAAIAARRDPAED